MDPATPPHAVTRPLAPTPEGAADAPTALRDPSLPDPGRRAAMLAGLVGLTGLAALATGCATTQRPQRAYVEPRTIYPPNYGYPQPAPTSARPPQPATSAPAPAAAPAVQLNVIPRAAWTRAGLAGRNVNAMNGVSRITVHHEGAKPIWFTDASSTYQHLESIRQGHTGKGWVDIGYHFIVDRDGRVIEGRPIAYQGAHVADNNEHNIGVMVLGNFDKQRPADRQINALHATLNALASAYRVPVSRVYTHQELKPTACPGAVLQHHMVAARRRSALG